MSSFGPLGRRILNLAASPNGRFLALQHVPQDYDSRDHHWLFVDPDGDTFEFPGPVAFAPLDSGECLSLENIGGAIHLVRYAPAEVARFEVWGTMSYVDAALRLMPSGREALVLVTDQDDKQVDWGGGPPPDYIQTWLLIDLATGERLEKTTRITLSDPELSNHDYRSSRGLSVLIALGAPPWVGTRPARECAALQKLILPLSGKAVESAIVAGPTRLLTTRRVIDIASGATLLSAARLHDLSPDEKYALGSDEAGELELWDVSAQHASKPELPAHGGVECALFLPGGRAAIGTRHGGVIVVDCV